MQIFCWLFNYFNRNFMQRHICRCLTAQTPSFIYNIKRGSQFFLNVPHKCFKLHDTKTWLFTKLKSYIDFKPFILIYCYKSIDKSNGSLIFNPIIGVINSVTHLMRFCSFLFSIFERGSKQMLLAIRRQKRIIGWCVDHSIVLIICQIGTKEGHAFKFLI